VTLNPRIAFAGTPAFAVPTLRALLSSGADISLVLTQPDRAAGRGKKLRLSPVKQFAEAKGLAVQQPLSLREQTTGDHWGDRPDLLVVVAYGLILPAWVLAWPRCAAINIHASLLPRWRGAAPIQHAIIGGDKATGVSIMRMELGLDTGPVYTRSPLDIDASETAGELSDRLAELGADVLIEQLPAIVNGTLEPRPQNDRMATYAGKISKSDGELNWRLPAAEITRRIRAFNPWPICFSSLSDGRRLRIHEAELLFGSAAADPGTIVATGKDGIDVAADDGIVRLHRVQPPSAKVMPVAAYLNAHSLDGVSFGG